MRLCQALEGKGVRCWIAPRDVAPSESYAGAIVRAIQNATLFIVVLSSAANESPHVLNEIERAFNRQIPIIPFRIAAVSPNEDLQYFLSRPQWIDAFDGSFDAHVAKVVEFITSASQRSSAPEAAPMTVVGPPAKIERPPPRANSSRHRGRTIATVISVGIAVVATGYLFSRRGDSGSTPKGTNQVSHSSIAQPAVQQPARPANPQNVTVPPTALGQWLEDRQSGDSIRVLEISPPPGTKLEGATEFRLRVEYKLSSEDRAMLIVAFGESSEDGTGCDNMGRRQHTPFTAKFPGPLQRGEGTIEATASWTVGSGKRTSVASGFLTATPAFWKVNEQGQPREVAARFRDIACWSF